MAVVSIKNKLRRGNLLVGNEAFIPNSYESIATVTVGSGGAANVEFTSIPGTYTHLQIRFIGRSTGAPDTKMQFNGDTTTTNYRTHTVYGDGSSSVGASLANTAYIGYIATATSTFGAGVVDILDYANTNKYKTTRSLAGYDANGSGFAILYSNLWMSTSAVTSIKIYPDSGNFSQYSSFALYGIKGA
jgi:hypothetical protein